MSSAVPQGRTILEVFHQKEVSRKVKLFHSRKVKLLKIQENRNH